MNIVQAIVGVVGVSLVLAVFMALLPREFSWYTLTEFEADLSGLENLVEQSLGLFQPFIAVNLLLSFIRIAIWSTLIGGSIKISLLVYNILTGGGA